MAQRASVALMDKRQFAAVSIYNDTSALRKVKHRLRGSMHRLFKDSVFRTKALPKAQKPLISQRSGNVFHEEALDQLMLAHQSLQHGDSQEAISTVYSAGCRIFGAEEFDRALQHRNTAARISR